MTFDFPIRFSAAVDLLSLLISNLEKNRVILFSIFNVVTNHREPPLRERKFLRSLRLNLAIFLVDGHILSIRLSKSDEPLAQGKRSSVSGTITQSCPVCRPTLDGMVLKGIASPFLGVPPFVVGPKN